MLGSICIRQLLAATMWKQRVLDAQQRFSAINLLVVMSFVAICAIVGMAEYRSHAIYARELELMKDLFLFRIAIDQFDANNGHYPSTLGALVNEGYLARIPEDPFTKSNSTWQTVRAEADPTNPTGKPGVSDVRSGSDGTSIARTKYWDW
jgi:general secretion pathway protein G